MLLLSGAFGLKKHQIDVFFMFYDGFDVLRKKNIKQMKKHYFDAFWSEKLLWKVFCTTIPNTHLDWIFMTYLFVKRQEDSVHYNISQAQVL